ncbi:glycosyl transferase [Hoyosella rhizosphaerae]|uniref:Glycosyl transferase n=1 Tax=Hoyosella rhizosphaerae TaxID=1755582 RepID=A0A916XAQ1_9ACTN|nr:nucleotide disphospho-sugar-binding domain-containing protein [Hoyosella rhizosphaerae]MBN4926332.1 glycosyl transferase [Hoyosella rhizosphaerae]GGC60176.1 glycosyl transferase [Hoyosella rhizosphaerae]
MRFAVVAGPDPGHVFPAMALCRKIQLAGDDAILYTGRRWLDHAASFGLDARELLGLDLPFGADDSDLGRRIHERAATMSTAMLRELNQAMPDLVVSDVITVAGGLTAERLGIPWVELSPHPLYLPSRGLPPLGSGLAPGTGLTGRARDTVLRALVARDRRRGAAQRARVRATIGLPEQDSGPRARLIATVPALEVDRPDWPSTAHLVGPLVWEPTSQELRVPQGEGPVVMVSPSTAGHGGAQGVVESVVEALTPGDTQYRVLATLLGAQPPSLPEWVSAGAGNQDVALTHSDVLVCGGGHGTVVRALLAAVPLVVIPGGGDQTELAARVRRLGVGEVVRPRPDGSIDGARVRQAIDTVLGDPKYRAAARAAAESAHRVEDPVSVCRASAQ